MAIDFQWVIFMLPCRCTHIRDMVNQPRDHTPNLWDTRSVALRMSRYFVIPLPPAADELYRKSHLHGFYLYIALRLGGLCPRLTRVNDAENWPISLELSRKIAPWATVVRISYSQDRCIWSLSYSYFANVSICIIGSRYQATFDKYPID